VRILIIRVGALGDVLHALPGVAALRKTQPDAVIDWVVDERWQAVLSGDGRGPVVDTVHGVPIKAWKKAPLSWETAKSLLEFRKLRGSYDLVVDMQGTMRSSAIGWLAGGGKLVGYMDPRESFAKLLYAQKIVRRNLHVVDQGAALLGEACGIRLIPAVSDLPHSAWADAWAKGIISGRKICVLAPRAGWRAKQWSSAKFGMLAKELKQRGYSCVVNAPREDDSLAAEVVAYSEGAAEIVVCNVTGLIALVRQAALVVGGDTGPVHMAAAVGVPLVALFGPTSPSRNGPWGPGPKAVLRDADAVTSYKRRAQADPGLGRMSVEMVVEAVEGLG
jgi:heptosyltransferase-1